MKKQYDLIFSCGDQCFISSGLRNNNLQFTSYPFDWIKGFNPMLFSKYLKSNFKDYFLKENLSLSEVTKLDTDVYKDKSNGVYYIHDFKKGKTFDENYNSIKEKFDRRIKRLVEGIKNSGKILMIYGGNEEERQDVIDAYNNIKNFFKKDIDLLFIIFTQEKLNCPNLLYSDENVSIYKNYLNRIDGKNEVRQYKQVLKNFDLKIENKTTKVFIKNIMKYKLILKKIRLYTARLLSAFIPNKSLRKKIRNKINKKNANYFD